jgi:hypothetical protein
MDDADADEFEDGSDWDSSDGQTLRRDYLFYLLTELEGALGRTLPELPEDDAARVGEWLSRLAAKMT